ncbi:MAG: type II toxin-antitoxin system HipA family toxin [Rhodoferax sp.]|nr:type II toxin-antitoxin system HipA family toxin [Rhodoferax sp.]MDP3655183.1 type II toxin-antitoxin system HipA family toxin [Rhodoferax sp.]
MLKVYVDKQLAGSLFKPESDPNKYHFGYDEQCPPQSAVSLSMPVAHEHYTSDYKALHPVFDMNLPEGALADRLRKEFSKVIPNFDALALLKIVGKSQIGRLRFAMPGEGMADVPTENLNDLLAHDGAEGLFESLLCRYAVYSGISGAMPKVMVRATPRGDALSRMTHRGATHIVKAWTDEYPRLAENEYFCMRAAMHAKLEVPNFELSKGGKFLVVERFDLKNEDYLGFEDFCVLNGKTASQKYDSSYESVTKRIKDFVSPEQVRPALESFFKALALSCALKNGDAHLKNFGVLYDNTESAVRLSPIYDLVTTTVYKPTDILALTFGGTKRWPKTKALMAFARTHCNITDGRARALLGDVAQGVLHAVNEATLYMHNHASFREVGTVMLTEWNKGLNLSIQPEGQPETFAIPDYQAQDSGDTAAARLTLLSKE